MRLITEAEVIGTLQIRDAIAAMAAAFEQFGNGVGVLSPRVRVAAEHNGTVAAISTLGAALPAAGVLGAKMQATVAGKSNFVIVLFSATTGEPLAAIEANIVSRFRAAAASAVAMRRLARHDARTLAIFGTGTQAYAHAESLVLSHPFERVLVSGRAGAPEFADWITTALGVRARATDARTAASEADVICTCTNATEPLFEGQWVKPGAFISAIGSTRPQVRELDDALMARSDLIVVDWEPAVQAEAGEFVRAAPDAIDPERVVELGKLLVGGTAYTRRAHDIVVFKSVGVGLQDVALALLVWGRIS